MHRLLSHIPTHIPTYYIHKNRHNIHKDLAATSLGTPAHPTERPQMWVAASLGSPNREVSSKHTHLQACRAHTHTNTYVYCTYTHGHFWFSLSCVGTHVFKSTTGGTLSLLVVYVTLIYVLHQLTVTKCLCYPTNTTSHVWYYLQ